MNAPVINRQHMNSGVRIRQVNGKQVRRRAKPFVDFEGTPDGIASHETALYVVGGTAARNAEYYAGTHGPIASVHAFVDDIGIWQSLEWTEQGWHAGDGMRGRGNTRFIAVEVCTNKNAAKAYANAVRLYRWLRTTGRCGDALEQHHAFSGKNCGRLIRGDLSDLEQVEHRPARRALARKLRQELVDAGWSWEQLTHLALQTRPEPVARAPVSANVSEKALGLADTLIDNAKALKKALAA